MRVVMPQLNLYTAGTTKLDYLKTLDHLLDLHGKEERIAIVVEGRPEIFPVNYVFDGGVIVFRTGAGLKLERAPTTRSAFEVDRIDVSSGVAWSVVVKGTAHDISTAVDRLPKRLRSLAVHPQAPGSREAWMAIHEDSISGRRFGLPPVGETPWLHLPRQLAAGPSSPTRWGR